jgi:hypothetical protein
MQVAAVQEWARVVDASNNLVFQNAASANRFSLTQAGALSISAGLTATTGSFSSSITATQATFSVAGATPLTLNCTSGTTCGSVIQKSGTQEWSSIADASNNYVLQNASSANEFQLSQAGALSLPGPVTVTQPTGTAPFTINSTTPVANLTTVPAMYNATGSQATNAHMVEDKVTLNGASPAVATLALSGAAAFTSSSTFQCTATNQTTAANSVKLTYSSGSAVVVTGPNGSVDVISVICAGD